LWSSGGRATEDFVRALGNPRLVQLGTGNAVFMGGVSVHDPDGGTRQLVAPTSIWIWPAMLTAAALLFAGAIAFAMRDAPTWLAVPIVALFGGVLLAAAVASAFYARHKRRRSLRLNTERGVLEELDSGRPSLVIPFGAAKRLRLQVYANRGYADSYDVLITLGAAELCVHQTFSEPEARSLAQSLAHAMDVPMDPVVERKGG
jgi:hypothetical protein